MRIIEVLLLSAVVIGCYAHGEKKVADTNTNWLDCETDDDCDDGLMCVEGKCSDAAGSSAPDAEAPAPDAGEPTPPSAHVDLAFDGEPMLLNVLEDSPGSPRVSSVNGGWIVAWQSSGSGPTNDNAALRVVELDHDGVVDSREVVLRESAADLVGLNSDREASVLTLSRGEQLDSVACALSFVRLETGDAKKVEIPCKSGQAYVADIVDSSSWLVAATEGDDVLIGVYTSSSDWIAPLTPIGQRNYDTPIVLASDGKAASVLWGSGDASQGLGIVDIYEPVTATSVTRRDGAVSADRPYAVEQLEDRAIAVGMRGTGLWSNVIRADAASTSVQVAGGRGYDGRPSIATAEDGELLAVCYSATMDAGPLQGSLVLIDREGRPVADRLVLAEESWSGRGCDLAWSGDTILVAWHGISVEPSLSRKGIVQARRIVVTR